MTESARVHLELSVTFDDLHVVLPLDKLWPDGVPERITEKHVADALDDISDNRPEVLVEALGQIMRRIFGPTAERIYRPVDVIFDVAVPNPSYAGNNTLPGMLSPPPVIVACNGETVVTL